MEVRSELKIYGWNRNPPFVQIVEHQPGKLPFTWVPKIIQNEFASNVCGACGYTEFQAIKHEELKEERKKGYESK